MTVVTLFLALALPATGQAMPLPAPSKAPDKKICRQDQSTGTILPRRICHTRSEWRTLLEQQDEVTNNAFVKRGNNRMPSLID